jgi:uridine kinase
MDGPAGTGRRARGRGRAEEPTVTDDARADLAGEAAGLIADAVREWRAAASGVLVVALDGHGGAGKTTIAAAAAARLGTVGVVTVHTDDFFRPADPGQPRQPRELRDYYDWPRLVREALVPLRAGRPATFRRFDWDLGRLSAGLVTVPPGPVVLLEGVLSAAPELAGQVDRRVLVGTPEPDRLARLRGRISPQDWDEAWLAAERRYFRGGAGPAPRAAPDLIVSGAGPRPA